MISISFNPGTTFAPGFRQALVDEINSLRRNPRSYIPYLSLPRYQDYPIESRQETAEFLNRQPPCNTLFRINPLLNEMAQSWTNLQGRIGDIGHGDLEERLRQANIPLISGSYSFAENIAYGFVEPRDIVMGWVVDYNVPNKGHRVNLFRCDLDQIGIGFGLHRNPTNPQLSFRVMVVNEYGTGFRSQRTTDTTTRLGNRRRTLKW